HIRAPMRSEIELERRVAAFVMAQPHTIQPGIALPVDRAEDEKRPPPFPIGRRGQLARVPAGSLELLAHPGERRRPRKRHPNAPLEGAAARKIPAVVPAPL